MRHATNHNIFTKVHINFPTLISSLSFIGPPRKSRHSYTFFVPTSSTNYNSSVLLVNHITLANSDPYFSIFAWFNYICTLIKTLIIMIIYLKMRIQNIFTEPFWLKIYTNILYIQLHYSITYSIKSNRKISL